MERKELIEMLINHPYKSKAIDREELNKLTDDDVLNLIIVRPMLTKKLIHRIIDVKDIDIVIKLLRLRSKIFNYLNLSRFSYGELKLIEKNLVRNYHKKAIDNYIKANFSK